MLLPILHWDGILFLFFVFRGLPTPPQMTNRNAEEDIFRPR